MMEANIFNLSNYIINTKVGYFNLNKFNNLIMFKQILFNFKCLKIHNCNINNLR